MSLDKLAHPDKLDKLAGSPRITTRMALSGPAGLAAVFLVGAVAFGHTSGFFASASNDGNDASALAVADEVDEPAAATPKPAAGRPNPTGKAAPKHDAGDTERALAQRTPKPQPVAEAPKPVEEPKPETVPATYVEPTPAPPAPPAPAAILALSASTAEYPGKVVLAWSAFNGGGFEYYKLIRTTDGDATWPASGADELIAAIGNPAETWSKDRPPCGTTVFYRVFAVRHGANGYEVLAPSNQVSAAVACPPPPPATVGIGLQATLVEGTVQLAWGACASEHFNAYKIVRSQANPEPMYPENEATELIAAIGDPGQTTFVDASVASGQTWFYRVLARADNGGGNYIACQSAAVSVTIP
jgi:outer membrane biosynthesis protein TonB